MAKDAIRLNNVTHEYTTKRRRTQVALDGLSICVHSGEVVAIVGPSGSGKSTCLDVISGIVSPREGSVEFPAFREKPRFGYVFQQDAVFPWRTVEENLTFSLEIQGLPAAERHSRAIGICEQVELAPEIYLPKMPSELSGGELRRISLGMSLAIPPDILLLDEPTSSVDWLGRRKLQSLFQSAIIGPPQITCVAVTHDVEEAVWLGDRVIVINSGRVANTLRIDLPRPRTNEMRKTECFFRHEAEVIDALSQARNH